MGSLQLSHPLREDPLPLLYRIPQRFWKGLEDLRLSYPLHFSRAARDLSIDSGVLSQSSALNRTAKTVAFLTLSHPKLMYFGPLVLELDSRPKSATSPEQAKHFSIQS